MTAELAEPESRNETSPPPQRPPMSQRRSLFVTLTAMVAVTSFVVAGGLWWWYDYQLAQTLSRAIEAGQANTQRVAGEIDARLIQIPFGVEDMVASLEDGTLQPAGVSARLHELLASGMATGYGVAFAPDAAGPGRRLYAPYVERFERAPATETDFAELYPYNEYRYGWFGDTILDGPGWMEAMLYPDAEAVTILYTVPFSMPGRPWPGGVAYATVRLEAMEAALDAIDVGESGYAFLVTREGGYLVHPRTELVRRGTTVFETAWANGNTDLHTVAVRATKGGSLFAEAPDEVTGRDNWIFAEPLKTTGWSLFAVFFRDEFRPDSDTERSHLIWILGFGLVGLLLVIVSASAARLPDIGHLSWAWSNSIAAILITAIAACWFIADRYPVTRPEERNLIFDQGMAHEFLNGVGIDDRMEGVDDVAVIPTGVFVRSIVFQSGSEVMISGHVWQRYDRIRHGHIPRGFSLPETFDPQQAEIREIFRIQTDQEERVGWYFAAKLRQSFDVGKFPFDRQNAWVRLAPPGVGRNIVFVPDFEGYTFMNPVLQPGVADTMVLPGWDIMGSHFDYRVHQYNMNLGVPGYEERERIPELYFNVELRRRFVGPFVAYMVPLAVTAGMLFALLLISSRKEASQGLLGFSAAEIVLGAAALFFVASFQHVSMRESLDAGGLIYFEYFYFVLYALLMVVSINAILFASDVDVPLIEYADNLLPKVTFWPASLAILLIVTLQRFY